MDIKYTERGFAYIEFRDKYNSLIRVQQSSVDMTDCWIFIKDSELTDPSPLLNYDMVKQINQFSKWLKKNF